MNMTIYGLLKNVKSSTIRLFGVSKEEFISLPVLAILDGMFAPPPQKKIMWLGLLQTSKMEHCTKNEVFHGGFLQ